MSAAITTRREFLITSAAFAAGLFSKLSPATATSLMHNHYYKGPITDHFDGLRFFNPNYLMRIAALRISFAGDLEGGPRRGRARYLCFKPCPMQKSPG